MTCVNLVWGDHGSPHPGVGWEPLGAKLQKKSTLKNGNSRRIYPPNPTGCVTAQVQTRIYPPNPTGCATVQVQRRIFIPSQSNGVRHSVGANTDIPSQSHGVRHSAGANTDIPSQSHGVRHGAGAGARPKQRRIARRLVHEVGGQAEMALGLGDTSSASNRVVQGGLAVRLGPRARAAVSCSSKGSFQSSGSPGEQDESRWVSTSSRRIDTASVFVAP